MERLGKLILAVLLFYVFEAAIITPFPPLNILGFSRFNFKKYKIDFSPNDRILIVSPHPDDAVLSSSGVIQEARKAGAKVKIVYITYGSHNETTIIKESKLRLVTPGGAINLGKLRQKEIWKASSILGLSQNDIIFLGFPDFGTLKMWTDYFSGKPYFSGLTLHNKVFYKTAYAYGVPFEGKEELIYLEKVIKEFRPTKIIYPSLSDLNLDHRATGLFVRAALLDLKNTVKSSGYEYLVHSKDWPYPNGYYPNFPFNWPDYIANFKPDKVYVLNLSQGEERVKEEAIKAYNSQVKSNHNFMYSFIRNDELFFSPSLFSSTSSLPLWSAKELQKIKIAPYIKSVKLSEDNTYFYYHLRFYSGIPLLSKMYLFVYPKNENKDFIDSPKYQFIFSRPVFTKWNYKIKNNNQWIEKSPDDVKIGSVGSELIIGLNKKFLKSSNFLFSGFQIEKSNVRVAETPWWEIKLN